MSSTAHTAEGEKILIVDDDPGLSSLLERFFTSKGYRARAVPNVEQMDRLLAREVFNLVVLDLMLPGEDGLSICRRLRASNDKTPIIMLTAKGEDVDRIVGLEIGADDYLGKPFSPRELVARIKAILRRSVPAKVGGAAAVTQQVEDIVINPSSLCVTVRNDQQELSVSELRLLSHLTENIGRVVTRDFLYKSIFGHQAYPMDRSLDMLVSRLRKKLGPRADGGERIKAVRGEGYMYLLSGGSHESS